MKNRQLSKAIDMKTKKSIIGIPIEIYYSDEDIIEFMDCDGEIFNVVAETICQCAANWNFKTKLVFENDLFLLTDNIDRQIEYKVIYKNGWLLENKNDSNGMNWELGILWNEKHSVGTWKKI